MKPSENRLVRGIDWPVVAVAVVCVLFLSWIVYRHTGGDHSHSSRPTSQVTTPADTSSASPSAGVDHDPTGQSTQIFKARLDSRVKAFVAAYFSVSTPSGVDDTSQAMQQSADSVRAAVQPFATTHFTRTSPLGFSLYGAQLGESMLKSHTSITATPTTGLTDARISSRKAVGTVLVHFSKTDDSGTVEGDKPQMLVLVKQGNTWFVDSAPLT